MTSPGPVAVRVPNAKAGIGGKGLDRAAAETMAALTAALSEAADRLGADAIVGLRVVPESMTTFGYGTAVKLA